MSTHPHGSCCSETICMCMPTGNAETFRTSATTCFSQTWKSFAFALRPCLYLRIPLTTSACQASRLQARQQQIYERQVRYKAHRRRAPNPRQADISVSSTAPSRASRRLSTMSCGHAGCIVLAHYASRLTKLFRRINFGAALRLPLLL